jgi:hypothetical protein
MMSAIAGFLAGTQHAFSERLLSEALPLPSFYRQRGHRLDLDPVETWRLKTLKAQSMSRIRVPHSLPAVVGYRWFA